MRIPRDFTAAPAAAPKPVVAEEKPSWVHTPMPKDSRNLPRMNTPWVDSPFFDTLLEQSPYGAKDRALLRKFADDGYVIIDPEIPDFENVRRSVIDGLEVKTRVQDAWAFHPGVKTIATAPRVLEILKLLYQRAAIPFQTLNFPVGTEQETHSDIIHFHCFPHRFMCGVWVALEDTDAHNGPLHYYPGSHKLPLYDLTDLGMSGSLQEWEYQHYRAYTEFLAALLAQARLPKQEFHVKKGQALIWAANLAHGGCPILDKSRTRHSQVTHYYFEDCLYYTPLNSDSFLHRIQFRTIRNILDGRPVPNRYNGMEVRAYPFPFPVGKQGVPGAAKPYG